ncbi:hypothetical protein GF420_08525 [candidate division GN15 bacterium]|nr:hypothetical protein [candidate division GN15 bacterium]
MILLAFLLNLVRWLSERHPAYLLLNFAGAGLACWYAWAGGAIPFVVLEGIWCLAALIKFGSVVTRKTAPQP